MIRIDIDDREVRQALEELRLTYPADAGFDPSGWPRRCARRWRAYMRPGCATRSSRPIPRRPKRGRWGASPATSRRASSGCMCAPRWMSAPRRLPAVATLWRAPVAATFFAPPALRTQPAAHNGAMYATLVLVFAAASVVCALWMPWWALLPAGALLAWLLPGLVGVVGGLFQPDR